MMLISAMISKELSKVRLVKQVAYHTRHPFYGLLPCGLWVRSTGHGWALGSCYRGRRELRTRLQQSSVFASRCAYGHTKESLAAAW